MSKEKVSDGDGPILAEYELKKSLWKGAWVAQSDFSSGHDLTARGFQPRVGLCTDSMAPSWDSLSFSLSALP